MRYFPNKKLHEFLAFIIIITGIIQCFLSNITPPKLLTIVGIIPISIVIPIFNRENYLNRSLYTAIHQTLRNVEIVCIDDCSTDNSVHFIINIMKKDKRIKLVRNLYNQGTSLTRLNGVYYSNGEYIMSLDPDDLLYLNAAELNYQYAKKAYADVLEYRIKYKSSQLYDRNWFPCRRNYTKREKLLKKFTTFRMNWNVCKRIIRRSIYLKAGDFLRPYISGRKINVADDLIQCGMIYFFTQRLICTKIMTYIYLVNKTDNSESELFQSRVQNKIQVLYGKALIQYFYKNRGRLETCSFDTFLGQGSNLEYYNKITPISNKTHTFECISNHKEIGYLKNDLLGVCLMYNVS
ncbi:putative lipooligosaccharide biosynthesis galactosyltransferase [Tritrichomonas foetus]|uniref:Lipooligosaccharide biosynthesis galactosyltransferase n=1 Tax=Tritrichomonas foetus TaxID=1144522 RepID=A0A1J4JX12_9EUKA|nr:putative lipooligosaccharide biosynthesis galactosyltransferase [Tritrichomonas foetus]|eukprot:OHT01813.1 putative lipooligosaccharide biosynthesis galactosyltransferase [Tritrichomonas foetus]